jgi:hypothetical protein
MRMASTGVVRAGSAFVAARWRRTAARRVALSDEGDPFVVSGMPP